MSRHVLIALMVSALSGTAFVSPAHATFPGKNGRIVFAETSSDSPPHGSVLTMAPDGSDLRTWPFITGFYSNPVWSPDGLRVAYEATPTGSYYDGPVELFTASGEGTGVVRLTDGPEGKFNPTWSPDGTKIAYSRSTDGGLTGPSPTNEIWVMNADGSGQHLISPPGITGLHPSWSPDGSRIAFATDVYGNREIVTMAPDGTQLRRVTENALPDDDPSWAPKRNRLIWARGIYTGTEIWEADADGAHAVRKTDDAEQQTEPVISPDGRFIAFTTTCRSSCLVREVWRMKRDGTDPQPLAVGMSADWQRRP